jgi:small subunit ribosomal protein S24
LEANVLDGKRAAEDANDDIIIRKFIYGTFVDLLASEIIIKRRFNQIDIGFLLRLPREGGKRSHATKVYFLVGYSEELLSHLFKAVVKIQPQTVDKKTDLVFRKW